MSMFELRPRFVQEERDSSLSSPGQRFRGSRGVWQIPHLRKISFFRTLIGKNRVPLLRMPRPLNTCAKTVKTLSTKDAEAFMNGVRLRGR